MVTWRELVAEATGTLSDAAVPDAEMSARRIGWEATGTSAADWHEVADRDATERQLASFDRMVGRRRDGEPLQYVLGSWGFRTLDLMVDRRVLIPRPETEVVAGAAIDELDRQTGGADRRAAGRPVVADRPVTAPVVADLGTGSGAIGLAIAAERPGTEVWLTDVSADALDVARANLAGLGRAGGAVRLAEGHWFSALPDELVGSLAVVVSNPPYVASPDDLEPVVAAWEPPGALLADAEGRADLLHLVDAAPRWLVADGALVLELDPSQASVVAERAATRFARVDTVDDLAGRTRAVVASGPTNR
ncbi:MAG: peptide chain release factor N(5)-glutamine methyltransferase [Actinomycetota bacterium]